MINFPRPGEETPPPRARPFHPRTGWHPLPSSQPDPPRIAPVDAVSWLPGPTPPERVLPSGWRSNGLEVAAFEREFATYTGSQEAVAVSSGAAAVELCLRALRLAHGSRVAVSTLAPCSVVQAVLRAGLRPVLLDVAADTGLSTVEQAGEAAHSGPLRALVVVHWAGDQSEVAPLAEAAGVPAGAVVEDVGPAAGGWLDGQRVGAAGAACFSFYATANLPIGEGGMVATDDPGRAALLRYSREHGISPAARRHVRHGHIGPHVLREGGLQSGLSEQSAAMGRDHLERLDSRQLRRQRLARRYDERLAQIPDLAIPHRPAPGTGEHAWQQYPVRIERSRAERDAVVRALAGAGVGTVDPVPPLHRIAFCRDLCELPSTGLPGADALLDQVVSLPIYPRISDTVVERVSDVLQAALGSRRTA